MAMESNIAQVRYEPSPDLPPPMSETGVIGWLRHNLFSGWANSILTVLGIAFIAWVVPPIVAYLTVDSTWSFPPEVEAGRQPSSADCAPGGMCWLFIRSRIGQFMFGFYPPDLWWRPILVFAMFVVGAYGLLAGRVKNKKPFAIYLFAVFPFIAFWLLYGGLGLDVVPTSQWGGFMMTLIITVVGIIVSLPLGILLALGRRSELPVIHMLCVGFIEFVRGVPLISVLFMANVMLPLFLPEGMQVNILLRVLVGVIMFSSAYMAEVVRGGLQAIPKGQYEGAQAMGLGYWQTMRLIILPQALRITVPAMVNNFVSLLQDTTLVSMVGLYDFLNIVKVGSRDSNWVGTEMSGYVFCVIVFWICCFSMSRYSMYLERRLHTGHAKR
jgi:general L-amino acid transport system permease protein